MTQKKIDVNGVVWINAYGIISDAIDDGVEAGWRRAHKHVEKPNESAIKDEIATAVLDALCDVLHFEPLTYVNDERWPETDRH